jgi:hypothetical protein
MVFIIVALIYFCLFLLWAAFVVWLFLAELRRRPP